VNPFNATVGWLADNKQPGRFEVAFVAADGWLAVDVTTLTSHPDVVDWLPVEIVKVGDGIVTLATADGSTHTHTAARRIVLREATS
jgi:hypothetical protein